MSENRLVLRALQKIEEKDIAIDETYSGFNSLGFEIPGRKPDQSHYPSFWLNQEENRLEIVIRIALGPYKLDLMGKKLNVLLDQWQEVIDLTKHDIAADWELNLESNLSLPDVNEPEEAWFEMGHYGFAKLVKGVRTVDEAVQVVVGVLKSEPEVRDKFFFLE